jgi:hypothetical protein
VKFTNRFNLPDPFVAALSSDDYARGEADFTTTELVRPVRIQSLTRAHWDELEEDVSDRVWALSGQVKHVILERIARVDPKRYLVEQRLEATLPGGKEISGQIDLFDMKDNTQYDWKETSVWKFILGDLEEWEQQGNINMYLLRENGVVVKALKNVALLKDWKVRKARTTRREDYPQCAINVVDLPMWSVGQQQNFIAKRILAHELAKKDPPVCTRKERWQRDKVFAVMRKNRKSAIRLCDDEDKAEAMVKWYTDHARPGETFYLEERPTEPVRCLDFCPVQQYCDFGIEAVAKWRKEFSE